MPAPLAAQRVSAAYKGAPLALDSISMTVEAGKVTAILGPNGAGKSTLIKALTGLIALQSGSVQLFGADMSQLSRRDIARRIAVVPGQVQVAFDFCVRDVVLMGRAPHQGAMLVASQRDSQIVDQVLDRTNLTPIAHRCVRHLSMGEQMRVAIARALAQQPDILVLDESTAHLDIRHRVAIHAIVRSEVRQRNLAALTVVHDLNEAAQNADHVVVMSQGRIQAQGAVAEVMTYRILRETFGVDIYVGVNELDGTRYFVPIRDKDPDQPST